MLFPRLALPASCPLCGPSASRHLMTTVKMGFPLSWTRKTESNCSTTPPTPEGTASVHESTHEPCTIMRHVPHSFPDTDKEVEGPKRDSPSVRNCRRPLRACCRCWSSSQLRIVQRPQVSLTLGSEAKFPPFNAHVRLIRCEAVQIARHRHVDALHRS